MAVPVSSLSIAVQGIADFLDGQFGEDVTISTDTPQRANERVKGGNKHFLNLFVYRIMPSGIHPAAADDTPCFVRLSVLLTPFLSDQLDENDDDDLRILGHAIRVLHSLPVVPGVLPGNSNDPNDFRSQQHLDYRLQAILQAPTMEELNHIWTTQGGELAYRLSAAYEFALIPIEPLVHGIEAGPVSTSIIDVQPNLAATDAGGFIAYGEDASAMPIGGVGPGQPPPATNWLPVVLFVRGGALSNSETVAAGTSDVAVSIAGPDGERVALEISWTRADSSTDTQGPQVFTIDGPRIDDPAAVHQLNLLNAAAGDEATVRTRPVDATGQPLATSAFANTLSILVGGA